MLLGIHHVQITIPPGTEAEARRFYCGLLGLSEIPKPEPLRARGGFWLELGGQQVHVGIESSVARTGSKAHIAYRVDDLDRWRSLLEREGIPVLPGIDISGFRRFEFRDPFGNRVEFLEQI